MSLTLALALAATLSTGRGLAPAIQAELRTVRTTILEGRNALQACFLRATRRNRLRVDQDSNHPWPPIGPTWETDAAVAFERAREEKTGVFVYIATGG